MEIIMNITITARHFEASQNLKDLTEKTVRKFEHFYSRIVHCEVIYEPSASPASPQKVELHLKIPQKDICCY